MGMKKRGIPDIFTKVKPKNRVFNRDDWLYREIRDIIEDDIGDDPNYFYGLGAVPQGSE